MKSINFTLLADESLAKDFGKKGTSTDITIYDKKESGVLRTWTIPTSFPDKIQSLFQAINMGEYVVFHVTKLDKFTGEQIIALDMLGKKQGILSHSFDVDKNTLLSMIKGTVVEQYKLVEPENLKKEIDLLEPISKD
ncbi:MAG TPA: elongation factor Tu, partial [Candidatus Nitrosotalea sp.]|nr:elongation factor Tu [Candidatus Nitrosotalea sp.]